MFPSCQTWLSVCGPGAASSGVPNSTHGDLVLCPTPTAPGTAPCPAMTSAPTRTAIGHHHQPRSVPLRGDGAGGQPVPQVQCCPVVAAVHGERAFPAHGPPTFATCSHWCAARHRLEPPRQRPSTVRVGVPRAVHNGISGTQRVRSNSVRCHICPTVLNGKLAGRQHCLNGYQRCSMSSNAERGGFDSRPPPPNLN